MFNTRARAFLCLLVISLFAVSCSKKGNAGTTGPTGPAGPAGPAYKGMIAGFVSVYDQYGSKLLNGLRNIQVALNSTNSTLTDSIGHFSFDSVVTGTYNIAVSGQGLAPTIVRNVAFIKDTLYFDVKISALPTFNLESFHAYHNTGSLYDSLVFAVEPDTRARNLIIFVNNNRIVNNMPANYLLSYVRAIPASFNSPQYIVFRIPNTDLNYTNIFYGQEVYYAAYSYIVNDASAYEEITVGRNVFNAVGLPLIDSAIAP